MLQELKFFNAKFFENWDFQTLQKQVIKITKWHLNQIKTTLSK